MYDSHEFKGKIAAIILEASPLASYGKGLAGRSSDNQVRQRYAVCVPQIRRDGAHVAP